MLNKKKAPWEGAPTDSNSLIIEQLSTHGAVIERHYPEHDTCAGRLLVELLEGRVVTPRSADGMTHSMRAAAYIFRLRRWGWPIATEMRDGANKFEPVRYAVYRLVGVEIGPRETMYLATAKRNAAVAASDISGVGKD